MNISSIASPMGSGVTGIQRGFARLEQSATQIASVTANPESSSPSSFDRPLVDMVRARVDTGASAKVVQTADRMLGSLLDIKA
ncbi:MAG: flagellar biosynthesis protein FlgE [Pseudomonadota bacterium]